MNVSSISNITKTAASNQTEDKSVSEEYKTLIEQFTNAQPYQTRDEINAEDGELAKFKEDLFTKGAAVFLKELDEEKIKALVEEYRQKLLKEKERNPQIPMDINKMVSDFKKQLIEELMEAQKAERGKKPTDTALLSSSEMLQNIKALRNDEKPSGLPEIGFLAQILNPSNRETRQEDLPG